jgi:putative transposase
MPRKNLILTNEYPYHITNRSNNKDFFYVPLDILWNIFEDVLVSLVDEYDINIHAFVLMSNHYHLVLNTTNENLSDVMTYLHREVARKGNKCAGRSNHFFGGRYKWCLIQNDIYYSNTIRYVFQNPLRAGVVKKVEEYRFSSLGKKLTYHKAWQRPEMCSSIIEGSANLNWLNNRLDDSEEAALKGALRRRVFKLPTTNFNIVTRLSCDTL